MGVGLAGRPRSLNLWAEPLPCLLTRTCCAPGQAGPGTLGQGHGNPSSKGCWLGNLSPQLRIHQSGYMGAKMYIFYAFCLLKLLPCSPVPQKQMGGYVPPTQLPPRLLAPALSASFCCILCATSRLPEQCTHVPSLVLLHPLPISKEGVHLL